MTPEEWDRINDHVSEAMLEHVRSFVTPLTKEHDATVRTVGTGTYVDFRGHPSLLTCEHVAREVPLGFRFRGSTTGDVFRCDGPWTMDADAAADIAYHQVASSAWSAMAHRAIAIPFDRFASEHRLYRREELIFLMGFAGENSHYGFGQHDAYGTGYLSQQKLAAGTDIFEMLWVPGAARFATGTSDQAKANMAVKDARGFSGSLAWNTRYLEVILQGGQWTPLDAVVTGLVRRWDPDTQTLLVWRVEHVRAWLEGH